MYPEHTALGFCHSSLWLFWENYTADSCL